MPQLSPPGAGGPVVLHTCYCTPYFRGWFPLKPQFHRYLHGVHSDRNYRNRRAYSMDFEMQSSSSFNCASGLIPVRRGSGLLGRFLLTSCIIFAKSRPGNGLYESSKVTQYLSVNTGILSGSRVIISRSNAILGSFRRSVATIPLRSRKPSPRGTSDNRNPSSY